MIRSSFKMLGRDYKFLAQDHENQARTSRVRIALAKYASSPPYCFGIVERENERVDGLEGEDTT